MEESLEKKIAMVMLALERQELERARLADRHRDRNIQYCLDDPEVAAWLTSCRKKGWGYATVFSDPVRGY